MHRFLRFLRRRWLVLLVSGGTLAILLLCSVATWWAASCIASPPRRPLMGYHREFLGDPSLRGVAVQYFTMDDGTPVIICTPDPKAALNERAKTLRSQLKQRGVRLSPPGRVVGNLVLLHGRTGRKEDFLPVAERFCAAGFRCIIPDLPGHGDNPAPLATYGLKEAKLPARVLDEASRKFHFQQQPAMLLGNSMGGSIAVHAAALPDAPWNALAVLASFDRFSSAAECQAREYVSGAIAKPWLFTTDLLYKMETGVSLRDINPGRKAPLVHMPVIVALATNDEVAPLACGRRLYESFTGAPRKKKIEVPEARHGNILATSYPLYADLAEWMLASLPNPKGREARP